MGLQGSAKGEGGDFVGKGLTTQAWRSKFDPWNLRKSKRRELTPQSSPGASTCALCYKCAVFTHTEDAHGDKLENEKVFSFSVRGWENRKQRRESLEQSERGQRDYKHSVGAFSVELLVC